MIEQLKKSFFFPALGLLVAVGLVALDWNGPYIADDFVHFVNAQYLLHWPSWSDLTAGGLSWGYRPVLSFFYFLEYHFGGFDAGRMRLLNLLFHLICFGLVLQLMRKRRTLSPLVILVGLIFFAFHPSAWHSILYIAARSTLLVATFVLAAVLVSLEDFPRCLGCVPLIACAVLSKETGWLSIPLILVFNIHRFRGPKLFRPVPILALVPIFAILVYFRGSVLTELFRNHDLGHDWDYYFLTQWKISLMYLKLTVVPFAGWAFFHGPGLVESLSSPSAWASGAGLLAFILASYFVTLKYGPKGSVWPLTAFLVCYFPEFVFPRELMATEQRMYLPLAFFSIWIGDLLSLLPENPLRKKTLISALSFILVGFISTTAWRATVYSSENSIYEHDNSVEPENLVALPMMAEAAFQRQDIGQARPLFYKAIHLFKEQTEHSRWFREEIEKSFHRYVTIALMTGVSFDDLQKILHSCEDEFHIGQGSCLYDEIVVMNATGHPEAALRLVKVMNQAPLVQTQEFMALLQLGRVEEAFPVGKSVALTQLDNPEFILRLAQIGAQFDPPWTARLLEQTMDYERRAGLPIDSRILASYQRLTSTPSAPTPGPSSPK